jgi:fibro-slime domain-containing protein
MVRSASGFARVCSGLGCLAALALGAEAGCGARTELWLAHTPCPEEAEVRACVDACGEGSSVCEDGFWSECDVPRQQRSCRTECGAGIEACERGTWGACEVAVSERSCTNACGTGVERCEAGRWTSCDVLPVDLACSDGCGDGVQRCEEGKLGTCEVPVFYRACRSVCGEGREACANGAWQACDAPQPKPPRLRAIVRDFSVTHPDFEIMSPGAQSRVDPLIVDSVLGADDTPVYLGDPATGKTPSTTGPENFYEWYHDVPGVNVTTELPLQLENSPATPGLFVYSDTTFFPIDDQLLGNENYRHNYHFTLEAETTFQYLGGEVFHFTGDDDMWVFINRRLAINLGGLHSPRSATVELDEVAAGHGLFPGETYPLHFYFAERHTVSSNFTIETSIAEPGACD